MSVNPIRTKGADYARHNTTVPPHHFGRCGVSELEKTSLNVECFDWDNLHLTALMKESYFR
jgi:hypothetical protein